MNDEYLSDDEYLEDDDVMDDGLEDDYEEISSDEVDSVVHTLENLIEGIASENIRTILEEANEKLLRLVYTEDELELDVDLDDEDDMAEEDEMLLDEAA